MQIGTVFPYTLSGGPEGAEPEPRTRAFLQARIHWLRTQRLPLSRWRVPLANGHNPDFESRDPTVLIIGPDGSLKPRKEIAEVQERLYRKQINPGDIVNLANHTGPSAEAASSAESPPQVTIDTTTANVEHQLRIYCHINGPTANQKHRYFIFQTTPNPLPLPPRWNIYRIHANKTCTHYREHRDRMCVCRAFVLSTNTQGATSSDRRTS